MVDLEALKNKIADSGMTMVSIAKKSNIKRETLYSRLNNIGEFTASEIVGLCSALNMTVEEINKIFLGGYLNKFNK